MQNSIYIDKTEVFFDSNINDQQSNKHFFIAIDKKNMIDIYVKCDIIIPRRIPPASTKTYQESALL
jgi:hypothetical protein